MEEVREVVGCVSSEGRRQEGVGGGEEGVRAGGEVGQSPCCHGLSCQALYTCAHVSSYVCSVYVCTISHAMLYVPREFFLIPF